MDITFSNAGVGRYDITTEHTLPVGVPRTFLFVLAFGFPVLFRLALPAVRAADIARQFYAAVRRLFLYGGVSTLLLEEEIVFNQKLSEIIVRFS